jgi:hypothetical protein
MPLTAAFLHIQQVVGGEQLAEEALRLRLASGEVEVQCRRAIPFWGIHIIPVTPEDFRKNPYNLLFLHVQLHGPIDFLRLADKLRSCGGYMFLRRADVYRIWPIAGADWMPLTAAFLHIQQVVGGEQLAEEHLRQRLASGDVEAQDRCVTPGEGIAIFPLSPDDFKYPDDLLFPVSELHDQDFLRRADEHRSLGHNIFLRRADVHRVWPIRSAEPASPPREQPSKQLPTTRPKGLGPKAWLAAQEVYKLRREGGKWIDIEHDLLSQIQTRLGGVVWLRSPTTLKTAVGYLRRKRLIDL